MSASPFPHASLAQRLRDVQAGVRDELEVSRHVFGGEPCYVVRDPVTFASHKLSSEDYQVFVSLRSDQSLKDIFSDLLCRDIIPPDQEEDFYRFVLRLNQLGLLSLPVSDGKKLYERFVHRRSANRRARILGILFLRVPLVQPDEFLDRTMRWLRPLFTPTAFLLWLLCVAFGGFLLVSRWEEFCNPLGTMLATQNLPLLWMLLIGLKLLHELGHAYACKRFGGQVTEMGAYFILFTPCAYVDASAAWGFPNRLHRLVVSLAGMYFESIAAIVALIVWSLSGPGLLHSAAQYTVVLSTVVTIGFNINPLMRYDGYYILSDLLGRPNLRQEATSQVQADLKRLLLGVSSTSQTRTRLGHLLLVGFGLAAVAYRILVLLGISVVIAQRIPVVGLAVAAVFVVATLWQLAARLLRYLLTSPEIRSIRRRAAFVTVIVVLGMVAVLALVPAPGRVRAVGTLACEDDRVVRARSAGFLLKAEDSVGDEVDAGTQLAVLSNVEIGQAIRKKQAEFDQLQVQWHREVSDDRRAAAATQQRIAKVQRELDQLREEQDGLEVRTPIRGRVTQAEGLRHAGRFVHKGDPLAIVSSGPWILRAVANAESLTHSLPQVGARVSIRLTGEGSRPLLGTIARIARAGSRTITDRSLTQLAGGEIPVSPDTWEAEEPFFHITIALDDQPDLRLRHGMTALVNLGGERPCIGMYLYRRGLTLLNKLRQTG